MAKLFYLNLPIQPDDITDICALNLLKKPIKRVFWIYNNSPECIRGKHRHHKTNHLLVCLSGSCKVYSNNGKKENIFLLNSANQVLHLQPIDWREMYDFSEDCILTCVCDKLYDPEDYIFKPDCFENKHNRPMKILTEEYVFE